MTYVTQCHATNIRQCPCNGQYAWRAGIEGTLSNGVRNFDLRRTHYLGRVKTHLQHILIAAGMNLVRVVRWLTEEPLAQACPSAFVRLHQMVAA